METPSYKVDVSLYDMFLELKRQIVGKSYWRFDGKALLLKIIQRHPDTEKQKTFPAFKKPSNKQEVIRTIDIQPFKILQLS